MLTLVSTAYYIVVTVVLSGSSIEKDVRLPLSLPEGATQITPYQCQAQGILEIVKWAEEHPGYKIIKWRCPPPDKKEQDA